MNDWLTELFRFIIILTTIYISFGMGYMRCLDDFHTDNYSRFKWYEYIVGAIFWPLVAYRSGDEHE